MFNMSAGGWAAVTFGLWIVGFPSYLLKRASLIRVAKEKPVQVKNRVVGFVVLAVVADCRRRLIDLYAKGLRFESVELDALARKTEGVSGAFIHELLSSSGGAAEA